MIAKRKGVPARYLTAMFELLQAQTTDIPQLLEMAGLEPARMERAEELILPDELESLIVATFRLTGRSNLALAAGRAIQLNSHDLLGYAMLSCGDLDQLLRLTSRYYHVTTELFNMKYVRRPGGGQAIFTPAVVMPLQAMRFVMELIAVSVQNQLLMLFGPEIICEIRIGMPAPPHHSLYQALPTARFHFDQSALPGIVALFDSRTLDRKLPMPAPAVVKQVEARLLSTQRNNLPHNNWGHYVGMLLREAEGEQITLEEIAARVRISTRTIERKLREEQLSFRGLSQQIRLERAQELLLQRGTTVTEVAERLGFSDTASLSRAFRRQLGVTPTEFRQRHAEST